MPKRKKVNGPKTVPTHPLYEKMTIMRTNRKTFRQIAAVFGISAERVAKIIGRGELPPIPPKQKRTFEERFWSKVDKSGGDNLCWEWKACKTHEGYGHLKRNGKDVYSHRTAWELINGPIPSWCKCVMHLCDNPGCCNPKHLMPATQKENIAMREERYERGDILRYTQKTGKNGQFVVRSHE